MSENPLHEPVDTHRSPDPCVLVIFGATGDLTARKLMPALYQLAREGQLPTHFACVGFARRSKDHDLFRQEMTTGVQQFSRTKPVEEAVWQGFSQQLFYHQSNFDDPAGYQRLKEFLAQLDQQFGTRGNRLFYLATQPSYFPVIVKQLKEGGLLYETSDQASQWSRVIIEKPFGHDYDSAVALQAELLRYLSESQIYRIDHYLGKETVQNILVFRFANAIFEPIWNSNHIDHVQISVGEELGVGTRGRLWEEQGMLRDIVQNHMMQLLSLMAMEPPVSLKAGDIHDEKVKVVESIRPLDLTQVVRGQYGPGYIEGKPVCGYREEENVDPKSSIETYVALQLFIDNWRWAGVPFFLRSGKRLPKRATEIAVTFREIPRILFQQRGRSHESNVLVLRIQPDDGISLRMNCKVPGLSHPTIQPVRMDFRYGSYFGLTPPEAYERLICDSMSADTTLFARSDEVLASWRLLTPVLNQWAESTPSDFPNYQAGTWGPEAANELIARSGRAWRVL